MQKGVLKGCRSKLINLTPNASTVRFRVNDLLPPFFGRCSKPLTTSVIQRNVQAILLPLSSPVPPDLRWMAVQIGSDSNRTFSICRVRLFLVCSIEWPLIAAIVRYVFEVFSLSIGKMACAIYAYRKTLLIASAGFEIRKVSCSEQEQRHVQLLLDVACDWCF